MTSAYTEKRRACQARQEHLVPTAFLDGAQRLVSRREEDDMPKAIWKDTVLAESDRCEVVEGNQYFPPDAIDRRYVRESATHTICSWKGTASYLDVVVDGETNADAAWYYPDPKPAAAPIKDYVAFWHGVRVEP
jgi:uncharacterized protein (DUF427 family)